MVENVILDWKMYKLTMYNLVQNAVKYNVEGGKIEIKLKIDGNKLVTKILNTGSEISPERIPYMMKIFGELSNKKSLHKVKDNSIGLGLTCSKIISEAMNGDLNILDD